MRLETYLGTTVFWGGFDAPEGFIKNADRGSGFFNMNLQESILIPVKEKVFVSSGIGLNLYLYGISTGSKLQYFFTK